MNRCLSIGLLAWAAAACSGGSSGATDVPEPLPHPVPEVPTPATPATETYTGLVTQTRPYPAADEQETERRGRVVEVTYGTRDYAEGTGAARTNNAFVYLPYGYGEDATRRYNILYLVHGHYGDARTFLTADGGLLRRVLDHMIARGDIEPLIVVTPSYNYGRPTADYVSADRYCRALPLELQHDLMPLIESRYRTYAPSADSAGLAASRAHRAIGGFSMGAVTTWYALDETPALFHWFLPMSGDSWSLGPFAGMNRPAETSRFLAERIRRQGFGPRDFYIWAASGTGDSAYRETLDQIEGMASAGDLFDLQNLTFHEKDGARHAYRPMVEYLYNALPFFFPPRGVTAIQYPTQ